MKALAQATETAIGTVVGGVVHISQLLSEPTYQAGADIEYSGHDFPPVDMTAATSTVRVTTSAIVRNSVGFVWLFARVYADGTLIPTTSNGYPTGLSTTSGRISASRVSLVPVTKGAKLKIVPCYYMSTVGGPDDSYIRYGLLTVEAVNTNKPATLTLTAGETRV